MFKSKAAEFARRGFRSLGVAVKKDNEEWELLGMLSMFDPPREDTAQTIAEAQFLGLQVKMLTGDAIAIAKETCKMLALGTKVYNSDRLIHGGLSGTTQHDLVERADGFAEVFPEHKYQVVEMIQQRGHLTAMTGDGVNDAPLSRSLTAVLLWRVLQKLPRPLPISSSLLPVSALSSPPSRLPVKSSSV